MATRPAGPGWGQRQPYGGFNFNFNFSFGFNPMGRRFPQPQRPPMFDWRGWDCPRPEPRECERPRHRRPKPCPDDTPVAAFERGTLWGDPHVEEPDGGKFDFMDKGHFNVMSDGRGRRRLEYNAYFDGPDGVSLQKQVGLRAGRQQLQLSPELFQSNHVMLDGAKRTLENYKSLELDNGWLLSRTDNSLSLQTDEYRLLFNMFGHYINSEIATGADGVLEDGIAPRGLLGDLFDADDHQASAPARPGDRYRRDGLFA